MAAARRSTRPVRNSRTNNRGNGKRTAPRRRARRRIEQPDLSNEDIRHLLKAPSDYQGIGGKLADAIEKAAAVQLRATAADRRRMMQDSETWRSMLAAWRFVQAIMPEHPELEEPFAFMQEYMSVTRTAPAPTP